MSEREKRKTLRKQAAGKKMILGILLAVFAVLVLLAAWIWTHRRPDPSSGQEPDFDVTFPEEWDEEEETPAGERIPIDEELAQENLEKPESQEVTQDGGWEHYLLLGLDDSEKRSDAMIVLSIERKEKRLVLSSVPRDTYVYIEGKGFDKLAHAYSYGGVDLTIQTFEENFDIDIKHYFTVTFTHLPEIVDLVGGVTLTLTDAEAKHMGDWYGAWGLGGGTQRLNGKEVLAYCRVRRIDSDYKRNDRQFKALMAVYEEVKNLSYDQYAALAKKAYDSVYSDMMLGDMLLLLKDVMEISKESEIENVKLVDAAHSTTPSLKNRYDKYSSYVVVDDLTQTAIRWRESLGITDYTPSKRVQQISKQLDKIMGR